MFHSSKQRQMLFKKEQDIQEIRNKVNQNFQNSHPECSEFFISPEEERLLCRKFERELLRFCNVCPSLFTYCDLSIYFYSDFGLIFSNPIPVSGALFHVLKAWWGLLEIYLGRQLICWFKSSFYSGIWGAPPFPEHQVHSNELSQTVLPEILCYGVLSPECHVAMRVFCLQSRWVHYR